MCCTCNVNTKYPPDPDSPILISDSRFRYEPVRKERPGCAVVYEYGGSFGDIIPLCTYSVLFPHKQMDRYELGRVGRVL